MAITLPGVFPVAQDLVAILDNDSLEPIFTASFPMRVSIDRNKTVTQYQVEDGTTRNDHVVENPISASVDLMLTEDKRSEYIALEQAFQENRLVIVQTKVSSFMNMLIDYMPHDESNALGENILVSIKLIEWREITPSYGDLPPKKVQNKNQTSTVKSGTQQPNQSTQTPKKQSVLFGVFN